MSGFQNRIVRSGQADPASLTANPKNWRKHPESQAQGLQSVLARVGWVQDVIVNERTGNIVDGHLRVRVALAAGESTVPVKYVDLSAEEEATVLATIDPLAAMAETDKAALESLLREIEDDGLDALLEDIAADNYITMGGEEESDDPGADLDRADELQKKWKIKPGDIWTIGRHSLLCGDSGKPEDVARLCDGWLAHSMVTDPPYGVDYGAKNEAMNKALGGNRITADIVGDTGADYLELFSAFLRLAPLAPKNTFYVFMSGQELHTLRAAIDATGLKWGDYLIWAKSHLVPNRKDYNARHEFIVYGWKGTHKFYGPTNSSTVLEFDRPGRSKEHPTMKPVDLLGRLIQDGTPIRGRVYDAFLGSGSTMVASEQTGRECRGIEIEPKYCAVTLERLTGMGLEASLLDKTKAA